jgi:hypothetical protein
MKGRRQIGIHRGPLGEGLQFCKERKSSQIQSRFAKNKIVCVDLLLRRLVSQQKRRASRKFRIVDVDIKGPSNGGLKAEAALSAEPRRSSHGLREIRGGQGGLHDVDVLDIEQVDPFFETTVSHEDAKFLAIQIAGSFVEGVEKRFPQLERQGFSKERQGLKKCEAVFSGRKSVSLHQEFVSGLFQEGPDGFCTVRRVS